MRVHHWLFMKLWKWDGVISTDVGAVSETIIDRKNGFLVNINDPLNNLMIYFLS